MTSDPLVPRPPIAIVGVSALCPGSGTTDGFLRVIFDGTDQIRDVPLSRFPSEIFYDPDARKGGDKTYCRRGAFIDPVPFDPVEFGLPPSVLSATDSSQVLTLLKAKEVSEDAGLNGPNAPARDRVAVIIGAQGMTQLQALMMSRLQWPLWADEIHNAGLPMDQALATAERIAARQPAWQEMSFPGFLGNIIAGRVTNRLDFGGTNYIVDAACASSLAAMSAALNELYLHQCDVAITGGVDLLTDIGSFVSFSKSQALSARGDCRPFSKDADGTIIGEGIVLFALRRLADAERDGNPILAVIRGHGTSSDGRGSAIYAPRMEGQVRAMERAYVAAGYGPDTVDLVEAHGTGTPLGDGTEVASMIKVFGGADCKDPVALGSVKSQIGHAKTSAGAVALFKVAASLRHKILPPTLKIGEPNDMLLKDECPFYLNTVARPWISGADHPRRASLSAFGFGGTNAHLTVEEYTGPGPVMPRRLTFPTQLLLFGAPTLDDVLKASDDAADRAAKGTPLDGLARETQSGFSPSAEHRLGLVVSDAADLRALIDRVRALLSKTGALPASLDSAVYASGPADAGKIAFMFPGQGSQYVGMTGSIAMHFDAARAPWDEDARRARKDGSAPLHKVVFPPPALTEPKRAEQDARLRATQSAQPALGVASLSLLGMLESLGVKPDLTFGHSFGEILALHAAGAFDADTAIALARIRGKLMSEAAASEACAMTAVSKPADFVEAAIAKANTKAVIANYNAPNQVVISGLASEVSKVEALLPPELCRKLPVSSAFHSPVVAGCAAAFAPHLESLWTEAPKRTAIANVTGRPYGSDLAEARATLAAQIAKPVRFVECVEAAYAAGARVFVEVGAGDVLRGLVNKCLEGREHTAIALDSKKRDGVTALFQGLARLSVAGVPVAYEAFWTDRKVAQAKTPAPLKKHVVWVDSTMARLTEEERLAGKTIPNLHMPRPKPPATAEKTPPRAAPTLTVAARRDERVTPTNGHDAPAGAGDTGPRVNGPSREPSPLSTIAARARSDISAPRARAPKGVKTASPATMEHLMATVTATQEHFLASMLESHKAFMDLTRNALHGANDSGPATGGGRPLRDAPIALKRATGDAMPMAQPPLLREAPRSTPRQAPAADRTPAPGNERIATPPADVARTSAPQSGKPLALPTDFGAVVLDIIAEKTGYPVEMIEPAMELEGDLGVDSIRRIEIFMALRDRVPGLPEPANVDQSLIANLKTVGDISAFLNTVTASDAAASNPSPTPNDPSAAPQAETPAPAALVGKSFGPLVLEIIADATGYPTDMLSLDMDLEADLGVDSIKRVEVLLALRERLPGLLPDAGQIDMSVLSRIKTLNDIVNVLENPQSLVSTASAPSEVTAQTADAPMVLDQFALTLRDLPGEPTPTLDLPGPVLILSDAGGVAEALRQKLADRGIDATIGPESGDAVSVICLTGLRTDAGPASALEAHLAAFRAAKRLAVSGPKDGGRFITVQDTGGDFGLQSQAGETAWLGGFTGLAKTVGKCVPELKVKAIDLARDGRSAAELAEILLAEFSTKDSEREIGLPSAGRRVSTAMAPLAQAPSEVLMDSPALADGDVIVVSGGARGVTAECLIELARKRTLSFVILGRSALVEESAELAAAEDDATLKRLLLEQARARGDVLRPVDLGRSAQTIRASRDVKACLAALEALGSAAIYLPVDVRDARAVAAAIAKGRETFGRITGIIHAAGVLADKRLVDKTEAQFTDVFETKVAGLANLLAATRTDTLTQIALFSSVVARFGNVGQIDYATANEVLNKVAQAEARKRAGTCRVLSIAWSAWAGGMVSSEIGRYMEAASVRLIPLDEGSRAFASLLTSPGPCAVEIVASPEQNLAFFASSRSLAPPPREALSPQAAE